MSQTEFILNGETIRVDVDDSMTLMAYLRDKLSLYSVKNGCAKGQCGACTVIVDGKAKRSCLVKMDKVAGASVETLENLHKDGQLHPLQKAFIQEGAVQCGFCTPGMIMSAKALLDENPDPDEEDIRQALKFNLCRCTGYMSIIRAVRAAGKMMRGELEFAEPEGHKGVGASVFRKDAVAKVMGLPLYADDKTMPDMLHGRLVYAAYPHARILDIDTSEAEKAEGVVRVATHRDIPGLKVFGLINKHQQILAEKEVIFLGDPVAVVYAETREAAETAASLVKVEYEELPGVYNPMEAIASEEMFYHGKKTISQTKVNRGNPEEGFAQADVIVEQEFHVPFIEHAYLEPECGLTHYDEEGRMVLLSSSQGSYLFKQMIMDMLNLPEDKVRVIATPAGGAFGGKEEPTVQLHCALGTYLTGRPVKITMTREDSIMASTKRHAEWLKYKAGATRDGKLIAFEADVLVDTGAYDSLGAPVVFRTGVVTAGPYSIPHVRTSSTGYYTNNPPGGAFRGFGSTQVAFAAEVTMDMLAEKLGMDPVEFRLKNALRPGWQTITGQTVGEDTALIETLEAVREALEQEKGKYIPSGPGKKIGFGVACAYKNVGLGTGMKDAAGAIVALESDGVVLYQGAAEMGQGPATVMAQILTEASGIPFDAIRVVSNDTGTCPDGEETTASRQTFITGNAVKKAGEDFYLQLKSFIKNHYGLEKAHMKFRVAGVEDDLTGRMISWKEIFEKAAAEEVSIKAEFEYATSKTVPLPANNLPAEGDDPDDYKIHNAYCYGSGGAIVEVDEETGDYRVLKVISAHDLGRAINPQMALGQIEGGAMMGVGYGISEKFITDQGRPVTDNLSRCGVPKITDAPEIEAIFVEKPIGEGPFGAKGMGELPVNPMAPAIVNAIYNAVGVRVTSLPVTKEKILEGLKSRQ